MLDGFLLFTVLDVWRILLPLGLSIVCWGTFVFQHLVGQSQGTGLIQFLYIVTYRLTVALVCIMGVVGMVVPWVLGYALPETHVADGPWSYEEIFGYMLGLLLLWRLQQQARQQQNPSPMIMAVALILFLGVALLWIARWDVMANEGAVQGGWFLGSSAEWEWSRLIPKSFHLIFSAMATGGIVVVVLGMLGTLTSRPVQAPDNSGSMSRSLPLIRYGVGWILSGLVTQMLIGPWLFLLLPSSPQMALIEGTSLTSLLFFVSLTTALLALVLLNASFMAPHVKGLVWGGLGNVALTLVLMGIVRYEAFGATMFSHRIPFAMTALTGWHVLSVFVLLGLFGGLLVRWCVWPSALIFHEILPTSQLDKS
ncbi:MAG: hypothetical protein E4H32_04435 [Nitrospirales bacterium]|nr:MAG: hypothetical protein E4H32_04435 [Nitrospirales bacterium]